MAVAYRVRYRIASPPGEGEWLLFQLPIRFGRNALNHCQIVHPYISDFHAVLELVEGRLCIRDLRSRNGVQAPSGQRMAQEGPVPVAGTNNTFVLGMIAQVHVEEIEQQEPAGARHSPAAGSVLGNRAVLQAGILQTGDRATGPPGGVYPSRPPENPGVPAPFPSAAAPVAAGAAPAPTPVGAAAAPGGAWASPQVQKWGGPSAPQAAAPRAATAPLREAPPPPFAPRESSSPPAPPREPFATAQLSMQPETLALQGLRELAASLVGGPPLRTTGDIARLITKLHDTVEVFCRCFVPLREGHSRFVSSFDLRRAASQRALNRSTSALQIETASEPAAVAAALLDWRNQDFDAPQAVAGIFADFMAHQIALVEGVMEGVRALLQELSPESIENAAREEPQGAFPAAWGRHRLLWQTFLKRYEELASETRKFELVFGPEFAAAYRDYVARQAQASR